MTREKEIKEASIKYQLSTRPMAIGGDAFADDARKLNMNTSFIAGAEWADAHPHWISVEDELPPKKSEYDCLSNNVLATNGKEIYESVYNHDFEEWFTHDLWAINNITHWMPLPAPPTCSEKPNNCKKGGEQ